MAELMGDFLFSILLFITISTNGLLSELVVDGEVGSGNYTYYRLTFEGDVKLILKTLSGDADLYVSENTLYPTFDIENHCFQSVTCGEDLVEIPSDVKRPVGIGVYGHPAHILSKYSLQVKEVRNIPKNPYDSLAYEYEVSRKLHESYTASTSFKPPSKTPTPPVEEESILWTLFIGILKVLLEVLT